MTAPTDPLLAGLRDASWLNHPDTTSPKRYHVVMNDAPACVQRSSLSSCANPMLAEFTIRPAAEIALHQRCQRPGCRVRWPAA